MRKLILETQIADRKIYRAEKVKRLEEATQCRIELEQQANAALEQCVRTMATGLSTAAMVKQLSAVICEYTKQLEYLAQIEEGVRAELGKPLQEGR